MCYQHSVKYTSYKIHEIQPDKVVKIRLQDNWFVESSLKQGFLTEFIVPAKKLINAFFFNLTCLML